MLRPHWLDEAFDSLEQIAQFPRNDRLLAAVRAAEDAFAAQRRALDEHPDLIGPSPAQAARLAFLTSLQLQIGGTYLRR